MRIDLEYLSLLLDVFLESDNAHINMEEIARSGIDVGKDDKFNEKFKFHL